MTTSWSGLTGAAFTMTVGAMIVACGKSPSTSSSPPPASVASAAAAPASVDSPIAVNGSASLKSVKGTCPATGLWAICSVEKRLRLSGLVARRLDESPQRAGFSVRPAAYALGRDSRLELFIYRDAKGLTRDMAGIDSATASPRGAKNSWPSPPILIESANLAAVLLTEDSRTAERLTLALTAGAPQR